MKIHFYENKKIISFFYSALNGNFQLWKIRLMKAKKSVSIFYFSLMGFLLSSTVISLTEGPLNINIPCGWRLALLLWVGPNGFMGLSCLTLALQREPTGLILKFLIYTIYLYF